MKDNQVQKVIRPILVTGTHRSGSTWVGNILAISPTVRYIMEPFNVLQDKGICSAKFKYYYTYIHHSNEQDCYQALKSTLELRYNLLYGLMSNFPKNCRRAVSTYKRSLSDRKLKLRPLMKDPIALLSAPWLAVSFNMDVVVLIRHPAAFIGSLLRKDWEFPFDHLLNQKQLMEDVLYPYKDEIVFFATQRQPLLQQGILLWNVLHYVICQYQNKYPNWIFVRHEDLSRDPYNQFSKLYLALNIDIPDGFEHAVDANCKVDNSLILDKNEELYKRDSAANIFSWKKRLSTSEIATIRQGVSEIAQHFYDDKDW